MESIRPTRPLIWHDLVYEIQRLLHDTPEVYLVGGMVRDAYRARPFKDIDLACAGDGRPLARHLANRLGGAYYPLDEARKVGRALIDFAGEHWVIDAAQFRGADLQADLQDRDFTVNALAVDLASDLSEIIDPLGGIGDLNAKILRRCGPRSVLEDPLRALRAVRQSLAYGLSIEPQTRQDIKTYGMRLAEASLERIRDEFFAILEGAKPQAGLLVLEMLGLLKFILPETAQLHGQPAENGADRWRYTLAVIEKMDLLLTVISPRRDDNVAANAGLGTYVYLMDRFRHPLQAHLRQQESTRSHAALLLFVGLLLYTPPQQAAERAFHLRLTSHEVKRVQRILEFRAWPWEMQAQAPLSPRQVYRFWRKTGQVGLDAGLLAMAEYLAREGVQLNIPAWTAFLQNIQQLFEGYGKALHIEPLLTGNDLMAAFGLTAGVKVGRLLEALREAQALGEISTPAGALHYAEGWLANES